MQTQILVGTEIAAEIEQQVFGILRDRQTIPRLATVVFGEDQPSQTYTRLKMSAGIRVGVEFVRTDVSFREQPTSIADQIQRLSTDSSIGGVMIQKPMRRTYVEYSGASPESYDGWWHQLTAAIDPDKDVDCLTRENLQAVYQGKTRLVPATVRAVLVLLSKARHIWQQQQSPIYGGVEVAILGRSELVGRPLAAVLEHLGASVYLAGVAPDWSRVGQASILVSATGKGGLITADKIAEGAVVIDVGAPSPDVADVSGKAALVTPVPDGVGPVTVACLMHNFADLVS